jgi:hypothetical protein
MKLLNINSPGKTLKASINLMNTLKYEVDGPAQLPSDSALFILQTYFLNNSLVAVELKKMTAVFQNFAVKILFYTCSVKTTDIFNEDYSFSG